MAILYPTRVLLANALRRLQRDGIHGVSKSLNRQRPRKRGRFPCLSATKEIPVAEEITRLVRDALALGLKFPDTRRSIFAK